MQTKLEPRCFEIPLPSLAHVAAFQALLDAQPDGIAQVQLAFVRRGGDIVWVDPSLPAQEVPPGTVAAHLTVRVPPYSIATLRRAIVRWVPRVLISPQELPQTCAASNVAWSEQNPLAYTVEGTVRGRCTVVFRQSFAPIWRMWPARGSGTLIAHLQIDGFANGWIVDGSGPVAFRIVNLALYAYAAGMFCTLACVLLAVALSVRSALMRSSLHATQLRSPA